MPPKRQTIPTNIDCQTCQASLADYVRLELSSQAAEQTYPEIAFHVEICEKCEAAYYREFRRQGQQKSLAELQQIGQRSPVAAVMQQIAPQLVPTPNPNWYEVALSQGRAWLERETGHWRQLWLSLSSLEDALRWEQPPTPALAGLMGETSGAAPILGALEIAPSDSDFEIKLVVVADPTSAEEDLCQVQIVLSLKDRFGDFSGFAITLLWGDSAQTKETDAWGKVTFTGLACHQLTSMSLIVSLVAD